MCDFRFTSTSGDKNDDELVTSSSWPENVLPLHYKQITEPHLASLSQHALCFLLSR